MTGKITSTQVAPAPKTEYIDLLDENFNEIPPAKTEKVNVPVKKATPKRSAKKAAGKKATPKAATKKAATKKASGKKVTKKAAGKKTPAAPAKKTDGKDPLRGKRLPIMKTLLKMGAISGITAKTAAEVSAKAGDEIEEKDVQHYCYKTMDLMQSGLVAQAQLEGVRKISYHLTPAGKKTVEAAK